MQPAARWRPVGKVLVDNGSITEEQLEAALAEQRRSGRKIGEILISSGAITWLTLAHAIAEQAQDMNGGTPVAAPAAPAAPDAGAPPRAQAEVVDEPLDFGDSAPTAARLREVETLLKDRQRAFLDLVSVTESLRATVARLQEELATRNDELAKLRAART
jgi:hypothetical protein